MFRQQLLAGASRILWAPSDDYGGGEVDDLADAPEADLEDDAPVDDLDDDSPEDLSDDDPDADDEPPARRPSRANQRIQALDARAKAAEERAERAERTAMEAAARVNQANQGDYMRQRGEALAQMDADQRAQFLINEGQQQTNAALQQIRFESQDMADKASFESLCARNPTAAKLKQKVEDTLAQLRASGMTAPRETILERELGKAALANAGRATNKATKTAAANRERQQASPGTGRSDVAARGASRTSEAEARRRRLSNVQI